MAAGHEVRALARTPAKLGSQAGLSIVAGDAADVAAVRETLVGCDAAISLLGNFNRKPNSEVSEATRTIVSVMEAQGPRRLVVVTTIGTGDSFAPLRSPLFKLIIRFVAKEIWRDRERQEAVVRASVINWTIVRPGGLTDGTATGRWTLTDSGAAQPRKVSIARADLSAALLETVVDPMLTRQTRCIFTDATG